jgi:phosphoglycolate phosphatase
VSASRAALFDLDGTFADTAPDLAGALNVMRRTRSLPALPLDITRPVTSMGARGMLAVGFSMGPDHPEYGAMRQEFLDLYCERLCDETRMFDGMHTLLEAIEQRGLKWGIVTNKTETLAKPLIEQLGLAGRCACVIGGDTTGHLKPHPAPLLAAARAIDIEPHACVYVGDDRRDIEGGRAAGMKTIAVRYGYLNGGVPDLWGADAVVDCPQDVLQHL